MRRGEAGGGGTGARCPGEDRCRVNRLWQAERVRAQMSPRVKAETS